MAVVVAVQVRVPGRVQGVSYRWWTQGEAQRLELRGWVRNEAYGSVAALLVGPETAVVAMVAALRRGPPHARVAEVFTEAVAIGEQPPGFEILG
jgi:acylphosphatase